MYDPAKLCGSLLSPLVFVSLISAGCLESLPAPAPTEQVDVNVPSRVYLASPNPDDSCERLFSQTATTNTNADWVAVDGLGMIAAEQVQRPHNCFVEVDPAVGQGSFPVEVREVSNVQYQLCFDSGACNSPDPSAITKTDVCTTEGAFDDCPVVAVSYEQAKDYCEWTGRRLPNGLEMSIVRQMGLQSDANNFPAAVPALLTGDAIPTDCTQSVLGNGGCDRPFPVVRSDGAIGSAPGDVLTPVNDANGAAKASGPIFDLVGNVAEMLADLAPDQRGTATNLPWFCIAALPQVVQNPNQPFSADNPPTCPDGLACIRGRYQPAADLPVRDDWPVCIAARSGQISGFRPVLVGGSYFEQLTEGGGDGMRTLNAREAAGVFARRTLTTEDPERLASSTLGRRTGFRCVGQRPSATGMGSPPPFGDRIQLLPRP